MVYYRYTIYRLTNYGNFEADNINLYVVSTISQKIFKVASMLPSKTKGCIS